MQEHLVEEQRVARLEGWTDGSNTSSGALHLIVQDLDPGSCSLGSAFQDGVETARENFETGRIGTITATR